MRRIYTQVEWLNCLRQRQAVLPMAIVVSLSEDFIHPIHHKIADGFIPNPVHYQTMTIVIMI